MEQYGIIGWIVIGGIAGAIAKLLMPGKDPGGCIITILLGIAGALLAGWIGHAVGWYNTGRGSGLHRRHRRCIPVAAHLSAGGAPARLTGAASAVQPAAMALAATVGLMERLARGTGMKRMMIAALMLGAAALAVGCCRSAGDDQPDDCRDPARYQRDRRSDARAGRRDHHRGRRLARGDGDRGASGFGEPDAACAWLR